MHVKKNKMTPFELLKKAHDSSFAGDMCSLGGNDAEASRHFASAAGAFWSLGYYSDCAKNVLEATTALLSMGDVESAADGLRLTAKMMIKRDQLYLAKKLSGRLKELEPVYPEAFSGGGSFDRYVMLLHQKRIAMFN
jgi:hypothetical protein